MCFRMSTLIVVTLCLAGVSLSPAVADDSQYKIGPDSQRHEDVPRGQVTMHVHRSDDVFPGTIRRYWVYVPAQYDASSPAAVTVFQDGHAYVGDHGQFRAPIVMDNLIAAGDMPVTIGIFIDPGHVGDELPGEKPGWRPRPNAARSSAFRPAESARSPSPGSAPMCSPRSSPTSAAS